MIQRVQITEEYGYREWVWEYPGSLIDLLTDWRAGNVPLLEDHLTDQEKVKLGGIRSYKGNLIRLASVSPQETWDAYAHIHMTDDTHLEINGIKVAGHPDQGRLGKGG